ncbi:malonyl-CoA decarboxylase [Rhizobium sp. YJ-22]|uniref:malonyl-CoA decarboxylase n=1 Tax=Rhizobium sp. YJ-22 TaxID=3037556 RepID=UPI002412DD60|nr:malonyl-CoA decarboxylase [Rhizobium sp. YJ-22]MDG3578096.1 malonyl-CoA decarboxylase [Rhizobium sp. YJ-22]
MNTTSFFSDMLQTIAEQGKRFLSRAPVAADVSPAERLGALCEALLSSRGEASGVALAQDILDRWQACDAAGKRDFMHLLLDRFGPSTDRVEAAIAAYQAQPGAGALLELHNAAEPRRQELLRRLNLAPNGISTLVRMRETLLQLKAKESDLEAVDADFAHLFASWFNRGFLVLRAINWSTPANILEKIIRYEAVHHIDGWDELRRRLEPEDRRCFAFFHPQLPDDPLIFVEVALTADIPASIDDLLREDRAGIHARDAACAVFYSISNCQDGLRGISFGNFLIKQVVEDLKRELPKLSTFVTLSPVPGFAAWLARERDGVLAEFLSEAERDALNALERKDWAEDAETAAALQPALMTAAAWYFLKARTANGRLVDPVGRFHLGNGARLERINFLGDRSARAMRQAHGLMVNYLYKLDEIETNHEAFAGRAKVVTTPAIRQMLAAGRNGRGLGAFTASTAAKRDTTKNKAKRETTP